jgi:hypothetical protein
MPLPATLLAMEDVIPPLPSPFFPVACDGGLCSGRAFQAVAVTAFPSPGTAVFCSLAGGGHALGVGVRRGRHLYLAVTPYRLGDT